MTNAECREITLRDGRTMAYAEYGNPRGIPIVHCHGTPSARIEGALTFSGAIAAELGVRIIVPDRPGMGRSDFQPGRRIVDWPNDVLELAAALDLDTFAVLGSSGGAPYAAACGALIPNRVRVVGLLGGVTPLDDPEVLAAMSAPLRIMVGSPDSRQRFCAASSVLTSARCEAAGNAQATGWPRHFRSPIGASSCNVRKSATASWRALGVQSAGTARACVGRRADGARVGIRSRCDQAVGQVRLDTQ